MSLDESYLRFSYVRVFAIGVRSIRLQPDLRGRKLRLQPDSTTASVCSIRPGGASNTRALTVL